VGLRRKARELALKAVFEIDFTGTAYEAVFQQIELEQKPDVEVKNFAIKLLETYNLNKTPINELIEEHSNNWKLSRMASVDRNILRLGVAEIKYMDDIPKNVTINEYLEVAKKYGTEDSSSFINGILDKISA